MICECCGDLNATFELEQERGDSYNYRASITCIRPTCQHTIVVYGDSLTEVTDAITKIEEAATNEKKSKTEGSEKKIGVGQI